MAFERHADAAVFAQHVDAFGVGQVHRRLGIVVQVEDVARLQEMVAAAGGVDQAGRVVLFGPGGDFNGFELTPSFIERDPGHDARLAVEVVHDFAPLLAVAGFRFDAAHEFGAFVPAGVLPAAVEVAAGHILPHEDAEAVAVVVPARRLHFHVLADEVEAPVLGFLNVEGKGFVGGGGVEAVGPPALVERAVLEERLVVEGHPEYTVLVGGDPDLAHRAVAADAVHGLAVLDQADFQVVEVGIVRRPETGALQRQFGLLAGDGAGRGDPFSALEQGYFHQALAGPFGQHAETAGVEVGRDAQAGDVLLGDRLQPDRLPDARDGGVPDAAGVADLLAAGLEARVGAVPDLDGQGILARNEGVGDIEGEGRVAAGVAARFDVVDPDVGLPVDGAEVQEHAAAFPRLGDGEGAAVPQVFVGPDGAADPGETRFNAEGDEDAAVGLAEGTAERKHGIVPQTVEVHPVGALHQRARVFGQGVRGIYLVGPGRADPVSGGAPVLRIGRKCDEEDQGQEEECRFFHNFGFIYQIY